MGREDVGELLQAARRATWQLHLERPEVLLDGAVRPRIVWSDAATGEPGAGAPLGQASAPGSRPPPPLEIIAVDSHSASMIAMGGLYSSALRFTWACNQILGAEEHSF